MRIKLRAAVSLLAVCLSAFVLSGCGGSSTVAGSNIKWTIDEETLYVSGTGDMSDFQTDTEAPWNESMMDDVVAIDVADGITYIGQYAFAWCTGLETAQIAESVENIGERAFDCCGLDSNQVEITFCGDAPSFADNVFELCGSNITVYYPADNKTWDSVIDHNYGADQIEWVAMDD